MKYRVCSASVGRVNGICRISPPSICNSSPGRPSKRTATALTERAARAARSGRTSL